MDISARLASELPKIRIVREDDKEYLTRCKTYNAAIEVRPLAIALPRTPEEVASIVGFASQNGASISVRCGGHDLFARSTADGAITIDIRALNNVKVDKAAGRAIIGGGVQAEMLGQVLAEHDCVTPCPNLGDVGYMGYAMTGGYGQMVHKFGLGVDHLLAATIVDARGDIVEADADVMKGLRGAGGNFGVVVEATIKIYPFSHFLAGPIIFDSSDYRNAMHNVQAGMEALAAEDDLPAELDVQPLYGFSPAFGQFYSVLFMWAGPDIERGRRYLDAVTSFHPVLVNQVDRVDLPQTHQMNDSLTPKLLYGDPRALNVRRITPTIYEILVEAFGTIPHDPAALLTWHEVRSCSPSVDPSTSLPAVFNAREPHYVIEILANAADKSNLNAVSQWGHALYDELVRKAPEEVMDTQWVASTPTHAIGSLEKMHGEENAQFLRRSKIEKDPNGVFRHAVPNLQDP